MDESMNEVQITNIKLRVDSKGEKNATIEIATTVDDKSTILEYLPPSVGQAFRSMVEAKAMQKLTLSGESQKVYLDFFMAPDSKRSYTTRDVSLRRFKLVRPIDGVDVITLTFEFEISLTEARVYLIREFGNATFLKIDFQSVLGLRMPEGVSLVSAETVEGNPRGGSGGSVN